VDIETRVKRYFKKEISYMLFIVFSVMFLASVVLTVVHSLGFGIIPVVDDLTNEIQVLFGFFMVVSVIGIIVLEFIIK